MQFPRRYPLVYLLAITLLAAGWIFSAARVTASVEKGGANFYPEEPLPPEPIIAQPSFLAISQIPAQPVGQRLTVNVQLTNEDGEGLPNKPVILYFNGERVRRARTDDGGAAAISTGNMWPVGVHHIEAEFIGTEAYLESAATATVRIRPLSLVIETLPPLPGMRFAIGGQIVEAEADGQAKLEMDAPGEYPLKVLLPVLDEAETDTLIHFDRWGDAVFTSERSVVANSDVRLQAGFALSHRVSQRFVDLNGNDVADSRMDTLTLKSSYGSVHTFEDGAPHWLQANRIARRTNGLEVTPVQYSVESVMIDGANVVNRYQQRFFLKPEDTWTIELLLYFARVTTKDAIFGFPLGEGITVAYPNGRTESHLLGPDNEIHLGPLARGKYMLQVSGVPGLAPVTPVALSRDQTVVLKVLSAFDIGLGITLGAIIGFGLLFYGRPQLLQLPRGTLVATSRIARDALSKLDAQFDIRRLAAAPLPDASANGTSQLETRLISQVPELYGWHACFRTKGAQLLNNLDEKPRRWKVTPAYLTTLDETLAQLPETYGYDFAMWTRERLRDHLERQTNISISVSWLGVLLKERGYVFRRPSRKASDGTNGSVNPALLTTFEKMHRD